MQRQAPHQPLQQQRVAASMSHPSPNPRPRQRPLPAGGRQEADALDTAGTAADIEAGEEEGAAGTARPVAASEPLRAAWEP